MNPLRRRSSLIYAFLFSFVELLAPSLTPRASAAGFYNLGANWHAPKITAVQTAPFFHGSGQTTASVTFSSVPTIGNTIIVTAWIALATGTASNSTLGVNAASDTMNTYTRAVTSFTTGVLAISIYSAKVVTNTAPFTVTVSGFTSSYVYLTATEWSGIVASSPVDQTQSTTGASGSARATGTTGTTTRNYELVVAAAADPSSAAVITYTNSSGFTARASETDGNNQVAGQSVDKIVTSAGPQSCNWTTTSPTTSWAGAIATFKAKH